MPRPEGDVSPDPATKALELCDESVGFGCAEATFVALKEHFGLAEAADPSPAMALNGGIAYSGGVCGAISGAALAVGALAGLRFDDHATAKTMARGVVQRAMADFASEMGDVRCRELIGFDLSTEHDEFLASGKWENGCMAQIKFVIDRVAPLAAEDAWSTPPPAR